MRNSVRLLLIIALSANAYSADNDVAAFNAAWQAYEAAAQSDDITMLLVKRIS